MEVKNLKTSEIKPYENNARFNDNAVDFVANSIREFGFQQPIVVDKDMVIIAGHTRYKAAIQLGLKSVPVIVATELSDDKVKAYRLADNKTGEMAEWDFDKLFQELDDIDLNTEIDMGDFGFDNTELEDEDTVLEEDDEPTEVKRRTEVGQIWKLGDNRLMIGDSTKKDDILNLTEKHDIEFIYTDPPYGMSAVSKSGVLSEKYDGDILNDENNEVAIKSFLLAHEMYKSSKQLWWGANYYSSALPDSECWIVWNKNNGGSDQTDAELAWANFRSVVRMFKMSSEKTNRIHPTQKPTDLFNQIVKRMFKKDKPEYVLDLFGGSGSTMIACEQMNIVNYSMELDTKYADLILQRWENLTGKQAELIE